VPDSLFSGSDALIVTQDDLSFGQSVKFSARSFRNFNLFGFLSVEELSDLSIEYVASQDAIKIQGKLAIALRSTPRVGITKIVADLSGGNFIQIKGGQADVIGKLTVETDLRFPPKGWGLRELSLSVDTTNKDIVGGAKLHLPIGRTVNVDGTVGFKLPISPLELNSLSLSAPNLNIPIPAYPGVFFQEFRGAVNNLAESDTDPIKFSGGVSATLGPQILGVSAVRFDADGELTAEQFTGTGKVTIVNDKLFKQEAEVTLNWDDKFFQSTGHVNILDGLIQANDSFRVTSNSDVSMGGMAAIGIPQNIPLFGGAQIASGNYLLEFSNNNDSSDDFAAGWGTFSIQKLGVDISVVGGFKGYFDGRVEWIGAKNIPPTGSWHIAAGKEWVVIGADWQNETNEAVNLQVFTPDGRTISEEDFEANGIAVIDDLSNTTSRVVVILEPIEGTWDIKVVDTTGLGGVTYNAIEEDAKPTVQVTAVSRDLTGRQMTIDYDAFDSDSNAEVKLYYDIDDTGFDGVLIQDDLFETDGSGSHIWDTTGVATGDYFVYAMVTDGQNAPQYSYSTSAVTVSESADLALSQNVSATPVMIGSDFVYTFTVENTSQDTAENTVLTVNLPDNATYMSSSVTPTSLQDGIARFALGDVGGGTTAIVEVTMTAPNLPSGMTTETDVLSDTFDPVGFNNADEVTVLVRDVLVVPGNESPIADAGGPYVIGEGTSLLLDGSQSFDADGDQLVYAWDLNDDDIVDAVGVDPTVTWDQLVALGINDDGIFTAKLRVDDENGHSSNATSKLTVGNATPSIALSGAASVNEGSQYMLTLGAVSDSGDDTVSQFVVRWGDGNSGTYSMAGDVTHIYADGQSTPTISVDLLDEDGTHADTGTLSLTVDNVAPSAVTDVTGEGNLVTVSIENVSDASEADTLAGFRYSYDFDNDGTFELGDGTYDGSVVDTSASFVPSHLHLNGDGSATVIVGARVVDKDGGANDIVSMIEINAPLPPVLAPEAAAPAADEAVVNMRAFTTSPGAPDSLQVVYEITGSEAAPFQISLYGATDPQFDSGSDSRVGAVIEVSDVLMLRPGLHALTLSDLEYAASLTAEDVDFVLAVSDSVEAADANRGVGFYGVYQPSADAVASANAGIVIRGLDSGGRYSASANDEITIASEAGDYVISSHLTRDPVRVNNSFAGQIVIVTADGDDTVRANRNVTSSLHIFAGPGADTLRGGGGKDRLRGGPGDDVLRGGEGDDLLDGGPGSDAIDASNNEIDPGIVSTNTILVDSEDVLTLGTDWTANGPIAVEG